MSFLINSNIITVDYPVSIQGNTLNQKNCGGFSQLLWVLGCLVYLLLIFISPSIFPLQTSYRNITIVDGSHPWGSSVVWFVSYSNDLWSVFAGLTCFDLSWDVHFFCSLVLWKRPRPSASLFRKGLRGIPRREVLIHELWRTIVRWAHISNFLLGATLAA